MFKSCFPNSQLGGGLDDPVPAIGDNPLKGASCGSQYHTIANAKGIYIDLLEYFKTRQDKLFVVIVTPPVQDPDAQRERQGPEPMAGGRLVGRLSV